MTEFVDPTKPSLADYLIFIRDGMGISAAYLPDDSLWIDATYNIALEKVNEVINRASPRIYTLMVYNYAADRLINYAADPDGQCFFQDLRKGFNINSQTMGMIQSSSDQGTSQSLLNPDWMRKMTLTNLEMMKTPYGRTYLGFAQEYGQVIWGLTA